MKCLVIGGNGFIGSYVVDEFLEKNFNVRVMSRMPGGGTRDNVEYLSGDIRSDLDTAKALLGVDVVVHSVTATVPGTASINPLSDVTDNLLPTISLLEAMEKADVRRLLYLSSGGTVYGIPQTLPTTEEHALTPINSYGIVKVAAESYIQNQARTRGLSAVIVRPSNPYGPRQSYLNAQGIVATAMASIVRKMPIQIWGDGSVVRDYIHVRDLAKLCVNATSSGFTGVINGGSGQGTSINELLGLIAQIAEQAPVIEHYPGRDIDVPISILSTEKSKRVGLYQDRCSLVDGLRETWEWMKSDLM